MNHLSEEQLVLYYYGEGDGSPEVRAHLDGCEGCRVGVRQPAARPERGGRGAGAGARR